MEKNEILSLIESLVDDSQVAVLATVDTDGNPTMRWMTPAIISGRPASLFAVTSPNFRKVKHLEKNPDVEWMIQTRDLNRVVNIKGKANVVDNPSLKSEVLESIGKRLEVFWRVNRKTDFLVLETVMTEATFFRPLERKKEIVSIR
jgi:pyridoxamine 5'-phosphate oxidase